MFDDTVFTPTFIDDISEAMKVILAKKPAGIFNVVGSTSLSPFTAACQVARSFGLDETLVKKQKLDDYLASGGRPYPRYVGLSNARLKRELGVSMRTFSEALLEMRRQLDG